jgi:hypothetical protein
VRLTGFHHVFHDDLKDFVQLFGITHLTPFFVAFIAGLFGFSFEQAKDLAIIAN